MAGPARAGETGYSFPVQPVVNATFSRGGHSYPGIDIFGKPGTVFIAPVSGVVEDIQREDEWRKGAGTPDKKGGRWVSLIGDDGYRYYGSHLESVSDAIRVGQHVQTGELLGRIGNSGNAHGTAPHLHFGISSVATPYSWQTRRGEIEPYQFLQCTLQQGCDPQATLARGKMAAQE
jgi:peptidoglycan LD-endopeptidase LytH